MGSDRVEAAVAEVRRILDGIDRDETYDDTGWWETSFGVEFGARKLAEVEALVRSLAAQGDGQIR